MNYNKKSRWIQSHYTFNEESCVDEQTFFSSTKIEDLLPTVGSWVKKIFLNWRLTKAQEQHLRSSGVRAILNTAGTGNGKTLTALLFGTELALKNPNFRGMYLTAPTNGLLLDLHRRTVELANNVPSHYPPFHAEAFASSTGFSKRSEIKDQLAVNGIEFLTITLDMLLMSLMGSAKWGSDEIRWKDYVYAATHPGIILIDEPDFLPSYTLSIFGIYLRYLNFVAQRDQLDDFSIHITSATIPNPNEFMKRLLGHDDFQIVSGPSRHGPRQWRIFQDDIYDDNEKIIGSTFE